MSYLTDLYESMPVQHNAFQGTTSPGNPSAANVIALVGYNATFDLDQLDTLLADLREAIIRTHTETLLAADVSGPVVVPGPDHRGPFVILKDPEPELVGVIEVEDYEGDDPFGPCTDECCAYTGEDA